MVFGDQQSNVSLKLKRKQSKHEKEWLQTDSVENLKKNGLVYSIKFKNLDDFLGKKNDQNWF